MICGYWQVCGYGLFVVICKGDDILLVIVGLWILGDWFEIEVGWLVIDLVIEGIGIVIEVVQVVIWFVFDELGWKIIVYYICEGNFCLICLVEKLGVMLDVDVLQFDGKFCFVYCQLVLQVVV